MGDTFMIDPRSHLAWPRHSNVHPLAILVACSSWQRRRGFVLLLL